MSTFMLRDATLLTMNDERPLLRGNLLVQRGVITAVGGRFDAPDGTPVIDCNGDYVMPGVVQTHVHLCQVLFRHEAEGLPLVGWLTQRIFPLEAAHDEASIRASAELGIAELLLSGTTCLLDMGTVHHTEQVVQAIADSGIRAAFGKAMMDLPGDAPAGLRETTQASIDGSLELAHHWHGALDDRIRYAFAPPWVLPCTAELQQELARQSREHGYLIHTHAAEHLGEIAEVERRHGARNVAVLHELGLCTERSVFAHCVHLDDHERQLLAATGTSVAHCPSANLKLGSGICDLPALLRAGVNVGIGADGAPCNNGLDGLVEMRLAHLLQQMAAGPGSVRPRDVLHMATRGGAKALGWENRIGQLMPGFDADIVRLRRDDFRLGLGSDPWTEIVTCGTRDLVRSVWVRGEQLVDSGQLTRLDHAWLRANGREQLQAVLRRAFDEERVLG